MALNSIVWGDDAALGGEQCQAAHLPGGAGPLLDDAFPERV